MEIRDRVNQVISESMGTVIEAISANSSLEDDLNFDSLDQVELVMALEDEFDIEVTDAQAETCKTVGDIYELAEKLYDKT